MTAKELREKRAKLVKDARSILDKATAENREKTAEERAAWAKIMGDVDPDGKRIAGEEENLKAQIDAIERQEKIEGEMRNRLDVRPPGGEDRTGAEGGEANGPTEEQRALSLQAWVMHNRGSQLNERHLDACQATGMNYRAPEISLSLRRDPYSQIKRSLTGREQRAGSSSPQAVALNAAGGYTIAEGFVNNLEIALLQFGGIRNVADVIRTASGNDLPWPTVNDTTVKGSILGENQTVPTKDMGFSIVVFHAYKYTSGIVLVPVELIEDSAFVLANTIGDLCGTRIGRIQSDHFTTGTGAAQPFGIMNAATLGVTAAVSTAIAADDIYTLKHKIDPAYRSDAVFMCHDQILLAVKKLKDGQGRYLWQSSLAAGAPDTLDGDKIQINMSMDSTLVSGKKVLAYGMMSKYKIRDVAEIRLRRLVERYADQDQEGFLMFMRGDGNLLDAGTAPVKYLQN